MATMTVGDGKDYTTFDAAYAAASSGDIIELYRGPRGIGFYEASPTWTKGVHVVGVDRGIILIMGNAVFSEAASSYSFANLLLQNFQTQLGEITSTDFTFNSCVLDITQFIRWNNAGIVGTYRFFNCSIMCFSTAAGRYTLQVSNSGACSIQIFNCYLAGILSEGYATGPIGSFNANTQWILRNCHIVYESDTFYSNSTQTAKINYDYCQFPTANTAGGAGANNQIKTLDEMGLASISCGPACANDFRTLRASETPGTTTAGAIDLTALYTHDIDGRERPPTAAGYAIGCSYGYDLIENADWPAEADVRLATSYDNGARTGTLDLPAVADVRDGVAFDNATQTGTLEVKDITFAEEAARNIDPGIANVLLGTDYRHLDAPLTGTLPGGTQPTAPTISLASVGDGTATITVACDPADVVYIRYRVGLAGWSTFDITFSRTGPGTVTVSGLSNGVRYEFAGWTALGTLYSLPSNSVVATPSDGLCEAPIIQVADEITDLINLLDLCIDDIEAVRTYVNFERLERITSPQVWVQPTEIEIASETRGKDRNIFVVDVGIFGKATTDAESDELMNLAHQIYQGLRRQQYPNDKATMTIEMPTLYSPEYLAEFNLFASILTVRVHGVEG